MSSDDQKSMVSKILNFDALDHVEKTTGLPYDDEVNIGAAMGLFINQNLAKSNLMEALGDSKFSEDFEKYFEIVTEKLGFEVVYNENFTVSNFDCYEGRRIDVQESHLILARRDGFLLNLTSYGIGGNRSVNSANLYFNLEIPLGSTAHRDVQYSGGFHFPNEGDEPKYIEGSMDVREAVCHKVNSIEAAGQMMSPWIKQPFLWLLNHEDEKYEEKYGVELNYKALNVERIKKCLVGCRRCV
jgi:hypothetical protein